MMFPAATASCESIQIPAFALCEILTKNRKRPFSVRIDKNPEGNGAFPGFIDTNIHCSLTADS